MSEIAPQKVEPLPDTHRDIDLREEPRTPCPQRHLVRLSVRPHFLSITVVVRDISLKGIGLFVEERLATGTCLALPWLYGPPDRWRTVRVKVVRISPQRDSGGWIAGCVFDERLQPGEVEAFLEHKRVPIKCDLYD